MNDQMDCKVPVVQFGRNRIHKKRHIVIGDFDHRVAALPAVFFGVGVKHPDLDLSRLAGLGKFLQRRYCAAQAVVICFRAVKR